MSSRIKRNVTQPEVRTEIRIDVACEEVGGLRGGATEPNQRGVITPKTSHSVFMTGRAGENDHFSHSEPEAEDWCECVTRNSVRAMKCEGQAAKIFS